MKMTDEERQLLLHVARWVIEKENADAEKLGTFSHWAEEMKRLVEDIRPKGPQR
jgi:hypothetical protein